MTLPPTVRRLLVCSTSVPHGKPHPQLSASMMILYHYLAELKRRGIVVLHVIVTDPGTDKPEALRMYRQEMEMPGVYEILSHRVETLFEPRKHTHDPLRSIPLPEPLLAAASAFRPDAIFCFEMQAAALFQDVTIAPKVVQMHDLKFLGHWYHTLYALQENPGSVLSLPMNWLRARQWRQYYLSALKTFDVVHSAVASSTVELRRLGIPAGYVPYAWPRIASVSRPIPKPAKPTFLFLGNLSGLGSRSALHFLFFKAYPALLKQWGSGGFSIIVCGANKVSSWITDNIAKRPELEFRGFVDDVEALMRSCHGVIAPIDVKTGNRSRILTAMSLRVPVVAHVNVALGNPSLVHGETCLLSTDGPAFAAQMRQIVEGGPQIEAMIDRAENTYRAENDPPAAANYLYAELQAALLPAGEREQYRQIHGLRTPSPLY